MNLSNKLLSDIVFFRSYPKYLPHLQRRESFEETINRDMTMHLDRFPKLSKDIIKAFGFVHDREVMPSMRRLQFAGSGVQKNNLRQFNCFRKDTKFVTSTGLKAFSDFVDGQKIKVLTHTGSWKKAIVRCYGMQPMKEISIKKRTSKEYKVWATKNHTWILRDGTRTQEIKVGDTLYPCSNVFGEFDFWEADPIEQYYWCCGYIFGDGTCVKNVQKKVMSSMVRLCGLDKNKYLDRFVSLGFKNSSCASINGDVIVYTGHYFKTAPNPKVDSPNLIRAFCAGYLDADGGRYTGASNKSKFTSIQAADKDHQWVIENLFPIAGVFIHQRDQSISWKTNFGPRNPDTKKYAITTDLTSKTLNQFKVVSISEEEKQEEAWCLEVKDDKSFILENGIATGNCSYLAIDHPKAFGEILFLLLSGCGVGFSVQGHHIEQLPTIKIPRQEGIHIVQDSISGWGCALDTLVEAYFYNRVRPIFDFSKISPKGTILPTTGAKAPGAGPLEHALKEIELRLKAAQGRKLRDIEIHDIICIASDCVLAGGIRRSSLISLFDRNSTPMLKCKSGDWYTRHPYRARANNSAVMPRNEVTYDEFYFVYNICKDSKSGEPGILWVNDKNMLVNPCFSGDTEIYLSSGRKKITEILDQEVEVWDGENWTKTTFRVTGYDKLLLKIKLGKEDWFTKQYNKKLPEIEITPEHSVITCDKDRKNIVRKLARDLQVGDYLLDSSKFKGLPEVVSSIERSHIAEKVYCCTVPTTNSLSLANGIHIGQCGEISLLPMQLCNLTTVNQTGITTKKEFLQRVHAAAFLGTLQAAFTDFPFMRETWKETTEREALIGVSFTGIADNSGLVTTEWLHEGAKLVLETNEKYAKKIGINLAARATTLKPEGSSSCVLCSSSGIHARHDKHYLRRVRISKNEALAAYLQATIPQLVEDDKFTANTIVVTIPQESPSNAIIRSEETANSLFDRVLFYNENWVRAGHRSGSNYNNVSATINLKDDEWDSFRERLWNERDRYNAISLLPYDTGIYQQAPFETCTKEKYEELIKVVQDVDLRDVIEGDDHTTLLQNLACSGGACEII